MPGKPALLAAVNGRPVVGVPGYPVSAAVAFREFSRPLLFMMQGVMPPEHDQVEVTIGRKIPSKLGLEEHIRVIIGNVGGKGRRHAPRRRRRGDHLPCPGRRDHPHPPRT